MRLTNRMLLIIVPTVLVGLVAVFSVMSLVVLGNFKDVEADEEEALLRRVATTIQEDIDRQDHTALDWAHWTETYDYMGGTNPGYPEANLSPLSYASNRWSFVLIIDRAGGLVNGTAYDWDEEVFRPLPAELTTPEGRAAVGLPDLDTDDGHVAGIVTVAGEPHMVSSWSILTNEETGPSRGTMVWASKVTGTYAEELAVRRDQDFQILPWSSATPAQAARLADEDTAVLTSLVEDETLAGQLRMDDVLGRPAVLVRHTAPRTVYQEGLNALTLSFFAALVVGAAFLALGLFLVRRYVTAPVQRLSRRIQEIDGGSLDRTLPAHGTDEVASMAASFGALLANLDERERRLVEQNRDLDAFAAVVSHDLLSPLSTVNVNVKVLEADLENGDLAKGKEHLARIQRTSKAIEDRVRAILTYARAGRDAGAAVPVDLAPVVRSVLDEMAADLQKADAQVTVGAMPVVLGHEQLLKQVLQNLVSNAAKYRKPDQPAAIDVQATAEGPWWRVTVSDDGVGFDDADVASMLTPFKRLDRTRSVPGHGIGLASCARIMERMGGRLELHGKVGVGGRASLILPAAAGAAPRPAGDAP